jgi:glyoxylase-like metal-dependent hydrolase (beta-lactamase superfamily II)
MDGRSEGLRGKLACRCILVEASDGLVLLDTGYGLQDIAAPLQRLSRFFLRLLDPEFREELTAVRQIEALGYKARDVRHIVLTHLDFDHAGGLDDFPEALVHLMDLEAVDAAKQSTWLDRQRFRPQQWSSRSRWIGYAGTGEKWFGFDAVREIRGLPPEIVMVPLRGHTLGHAGIAVREDGGHWVLLAGDAYFDHDELDLEHPHCTPGLRFYQWLMEKDRSSRLRNQRRLRELVRDHSAEVRIVCSHDPRELEHDTGRALHVPEIPSPPPLHITT